MPLSFASAAVFTVLMAKELAMEADLDGLLITADEEKLKTVIDNLASSSIKFSPEGGACW